MQNWRASFPVIFIQVCAQYVSETAAIILTVTAAAPVWLHSAGHHAYLKCNILSSRCWAQCFLLLILSTLFTLSYCSTVIKKLTQRSSTILTFHQGWDIIFLLFFFFFCWARTHLLLPPSTAFLFLFLAVFKKKKKILFQVSTHFVASKITVSGEDCDLPDELLSHFHSSGVYKVRIILFLPNCSLTGFTLTINLNLSNIL